MKYFFLIFSFLFLPFSYFISPSLVSAQTPTQDQQETDQGKTGWEKFWEDVGTFISSLSLDINSWFTKEYPISVDNKQDNFTDYNAKDKDVTSRAPAEKNQQFNKGTYLKAIIDGTYTDKTIAYICNNTCTNNKSDNCTDIKFSTLVFYFYQKGQKILYDPSNSETPIEYNSEKMDSYEYDLPEGTDQCFINLYNNMPKIPQGPFQGEENSAAASSKELNNNLRGFIPNSSQESAPSSNMSDPDNVEILTKDNELQQRTMFSNFIPDKSQDSVLGVESSNDNSSQVLGISTDTDKLKETFTKYMHPASWQQSDTYILPERTDLNINWDGFGSGTSTGTCNAEKSHCRGMSQYGALGLSQSGKNYQEILKFYYGSDTQIKVLEGTNYIKVNIDDPDDCPSGSSLNIEDYLRGLGEMPDYWGKESKGGFQALKAQAVAARTYAYMRTNGFQKAICNTSRCQVFKCKNIGNNPYLDKAIKETAGQILVDSNSQTPFTTEYARSFCGPSKIVTYENHTINSVNGIEYEAKALVSTNREPDAYCK